MAQVHRAGSIAVLAAAGIFAVVAVVAAWRFEPRPWLEWSWRALFALVALQALTGALVYGGGRRPAESLHFLYAAFALGVLPAASSFAREAPPKGRAWTLAAASVLLLLLLLRLFGTG